MRKPLKTSVVDSGHNTIIHKLPRLVQVGSTLHLGEMERLQAHLGTYDFPEGSVVTIHVTIEEDRPNPFPKETD